MTSVQHRSRLTRVGLGPDSSPLAADYNVPGRPEHMLHGSIEALASRLPELPSHANGRALVSVNAQEHEIVC